MNEVENEDNEQDDDQVLDDDQELDDEIENNQKTNQKHASYIVCPLVPEDVFQYWILRLRIYLRGAGNFEILVDQITTVSGQALIERIEMLPDDIRIKLRRNLYVVLGFTI
jgi:hypothetical protein